MDGKARVRMQKREGAVLELGVSWPGGEGGAQPLDLIAFFLEVLSQAREHRRAQLFSSWDSEGEEEEPDPQFALDSRLRTVAASSLTDPKWLAATAPEYIAKVARQAVPTVEASSAQQVFRVTLGDASFGDACEPGLQFAVDSCLPVRRAAPPPNAASRRRTGPGSTTPTRQRSSTPDRPSARQPSVERLARLAQSTDHTELSRRSSERELHVLAARSVHKTKLSKEQAAERVAKMEAWESSRRRKLDDARARKKFAEEEEEASFAPQQFARNNILLSERDVSDVVGRLATPKRSRQAVKHSSNGRKGEVGGESNAAWSRGLRGRPAESKGRAVAEVRSRKKKGGGPGQCLSDEAPTVAALSSTGDQPHVAVPGLGEPGDSSFSTTGDGTADISIFDKLTDSSAYTGTHKKRFDKSGRGRGKVGRTTAADTVADMSQIIRTSSASMPTRTRARATRTSPRGRATTVSPRDSAAPRVEGPSAHTKRKSSPGTSRGRRAQSAGAAGLGPRAQRTGLSQNPDRFHLSTDAVTMRARVQAAELSAAAAVEAEAALRVDMQHEIASLAQEMQALMNRLRQSEQDLEAERAERRRLELELKQRGEAVSLAACSDTMTKQGASGRAAENGSGAAMGAAEGADRTDIIGLLGMAARDESLECWLERLGIEQYSEALRDHGAISVASLADMGSGALGELLAECEVKRGHVKKIEKGLEAHREFEKHRDGETQRETQRQSEACLSTEQRPPRDVRRLNRQLEGTIAAMDELREIKEECPLRTINNYGTFICTYICMQMSVYTNITCVLCGAGTKAMPKRLTRWKASSCTRKRPGMTLPIISSCDSRSSRDQSAAADRYIGQCEKMHRAPTVRRPWSRR